MKTKSPKISLGLRLLSAAAFIALLSRISFGQSGDTPTQHVFGRNADGDLIHYYWSPAPSWAAEDLTSRATIGTAFRLASDPVVVNLQSGGVPTQHVFGRNADGDLIHYYWSPAPSWAAEDLTSRATIGTAFRLASDPGVSNLQSGDVPTQHVFGRNAGGDLIHYYWSPAPSWAAENLTTRATIGTAFRLEGRDSSFKNSIVVQLVPGTFSPASLPQ